MHTRKRQTQINVNRVKWMKKHPGLGTTYNRKSIYGLDATSFLILFEKQKGKCAICLKKLVNSNKGNSLCVDHDHDNKVVRGILCHNCNIGLGHFKDDEKLTANATRYLLRYKRAKVRK